MMVECLKLSIMKISVKLSGEFDRELVINLKMYLVLKFRPFSQIYEDASRVMTCFNLMDVPTPE